MTVEFLDLGVGTTRTPYEEAWELQRRIHAEVVAGDRPSTVLLLEHDPVYTAGKRTEDHERPLDGTPVIDVDRGGKITWHGPGQLVGYPIVTLDDQVKVVDYVRRLEEALIRTANSFGLHTGRIPGRSGVWLPADAGGPERKLAAIGIRVASNTTMHGFSFNVNPDLNWYNRIIACGIADAGQTSLAAELDQVITLTEVTERVRPHLVELLSWQPYESSPDVAEPRPEPGTKRRPEVRLGVNLAAAR